MEGLDPSSETTRIEILKKVVWFRDMHTKTSKKKKKKKNDSYDPFYANRMYTQLAIATTLRLSQADLAETMRAWLEVENLETIRELQLLELIGECLAHNFNRLEWTSAQLAQIATDAIDATKAWKLYEERPLSLSVTETLSCSVPERSVSPGTPGLAWPGLSEYSVKYL